MISLEANFSSVPIVGTGLSTKGNQTGEKGAASPSCPQENLSVGPEMHYEIPPAKLLWRPDFKIREAISLKAREEKSFVDFILVLHVAKIFRQLARESAAADGSQMVLAEKCRPWTRESCRPGHPGSPRADRDTSQPTMGSPEELGFKVSTKSVMNFLLYANRAYQGKNP